MQVVAWFWRVGALSAPRRHVTTSSRAQEMMTSSLWRSTSLHSPPSDSSQTSSTAVGPHCCSFFSLSGAVGQQNRRGRKLQSTFPTGGGILGAQRFNFGHEFSQNGTFSPKFCIFWRKFYNETKMFWQLFDSQKFRVGKFSPCSRPQCHCYYLQRWYAGYNLRDRGFGIGAF